MMIADVEIGCFLSGGIDSSLVASIMKKFNKKNKNIFRVLKKNNMMNQKYAKKIADFLQTDHHQLIISNNDLLDNIEKVSSIYDEPFGDSSFLPTYLLREICFKVCQSCTIRRWR